MKNKERPWEGSKQEVGHGDEGYIKNEQKSGDPSLEEVTILKDLRTKGLISPEDRLKLEEWEGSSHTEKSSELIKERPTTYPEYPEKEELRDEDGDILENEPTTKEKEMEKASLTKKDDPFFDYHMSHTPKGIPPPNQKQPEHVQYRSPYKYGEVRSHGKHIPKKPWSKKGTETIRKPKTL